MLPPPPSNVQCRSGKAGRQDLGGAPHGPVYQSKPDDGGRSEHQPPRVVHCHGDIQRYSPGGAENSSGAHGEQPGPLQSPMSQGVPQLMPLHVLNQGVGFPGQCKVRRL